MKYKKRSKREQFVFLHALEDIHMHIETRLIEKIGDAGKKLHTGRSRNDQVSLDMRLFLKKELGKYRCKASGSPEKSRAESSKREKGHHAGIHPYAEGTGCSLLLII